MADLHHSVSRVHQPSQLASIHQDIAAYHGVDLREAGAHLVVARFISKAISASGMTTDERRRLRSSIQAFCHVNLPDEPANYCSPGQPSHSKGGQSLRSEQSCARRWSDQSGHYNHSGDSGAINNMQGVGYVGSAPAHTQTSTWVDPQAELANYTLWQPLVQGPSQCHDLSLAQGAVAIRQTMTQQPAIPHGIPASANPYPTNMPGPVATGLMSYPEEIACFDTSSFCGNTAFMQWP